MVRMLPPQPTSAHPPPSSHHTDRSGQERAVQCLVFLVSVCGGGAADRVSEWLAGGGSFNTLGGLTSQ